MQSYSSQDDLAAAVAELSRRDGRLGLLAARHGVPPLRRMEPGLASLLRIVTDQLISLQAAAGPLGRHATGPGSVHSWAVGIPIGMTVPAAVVGLRLGQEVEPFLDRVD